MLAVVLAVLAALAYGTSDFVGGSLSRRRTLWMVTMGSEFGAGVVTLVVALSIPGHPAAGDWLLAVGGGVSVCLGTASLYRGLSRGRMTVVAPISALGSAVVPVIFGVFEGNRPHLLAWAGMVLVIPAILLVTHIGGGGPSEVPASGQGSASSAGTASSSGVVDGVLAGLGFGIMFCFIGGMSSGAGLLPMAALQFTAGVAAVVCALLAGQRISVTRSDVLPFAGMGALGATALAAFYWASQRGLLAEVSVITSLYPAITVILAANLLDEKIGRVQMTGLIVAGLAVGLVAGAT